MQVEEARIHAHVCGDGFLSKRVEKNSLQIVEGRRYHRSRMRYRVGYSNSDINLINEFRQDAAEEYGVKCQLVEKDEKNMEAYFRSKRRYLRLQELGANSSYEWNIGREILEASRAVKKEWLRAFFDDEAHVDLKEKRIRVKCMNRAGLIQIRNMLSALEIKGVITGPNCDSSWYLTLNWQAAPLFAELIGSLHAKKKKQLRRIVEL